ncbi:glutaredoxin family protein [Pengzhenrongella sicca]|uniref:Glutaredoxin family protein n=1 Tax=Pengzhenrongella sicca TaxID=2819238 RepID=A0A8A4ZB76_9MICO|nr:glutaredoxin family protein [Pengzhenrongella sicca]QTE29152.1 glutaredoxin family protein [Pengzhenrongella sicca]
MTDDGVRVVLYGRAGCHLCDDARVIVAAVAAAAGTGWAEVDIDAEAVRDGGALQREYGEQVPVVLVDGVQRDYWRIDAGRLAAALAPRP